MSIDLDSGSGEIAVFVTAGSEVFRGTVAKEPGRQNRKSRSPDRAVRDRPAPQSPVFRIGAVTFFRNVSHGVLAILQTEDGRSAVAYQNRAFVWDRGRRGIAIGREGPLLLTDAGIHAAGSLASFASFDPGPPGVPSPADRLTSGPDLVPQMRRGNRWYRRVAAGVWEPAPQPSTDAVLANDDGLVWRRRSGSIVVESVSGAARLGPDWREWSRAVDRSSHRRGPVRKWHRAAHARLHRARRAHRGASFGTVRGQRHPVPGAAARLRRGYGGQGRHTRERDDQRPGSDVAHAVWIGVHVECCAARVRAVSDRGELARAAHAGGSRPTSTDSERRSDRRRAAGRRLAGTAFLDAYRPLDWAIPVRRGPLDCSRW